MPNEMQELIAAAKVISEYGSKCKSANCQVDRCHNWSALYAAIEAAELARASEGGWIDCNQALPKHGQKVICACDWGVSFAECYIDYDNKLYFGNVRLGCFPCPNVTYWQPLPAPPLSVETPNEVQK